MDFFCRNEIELELSFFLHAIFFVWADVNVCGMGWCEFFSKFI